MATKLLLIVACIFLATLVAAEEVRTVPVVDSVNVVEQPLPDPEPSTEVETEITVDTCTDNIVQALLAIKLSDKIFTVRKMGSNNIGACQEFLLEHLKVYKGFTECVPFGQEMFWKILDKVIVNENYRKAYINCAGFAAAAYLRVFEDQNNPFEIDAMRVFNTINSA